MLLIHASNKIVREHYRRIYSDSTFDSALKLLIFNNFDSGNHNISNLRGLSGIFIDDLEREKCWVDQDVYYPQNFRGFRNLAVWVIPPL